MRTALEIENEIDEIINLAESEGRDLSSAENTKCEALIAELEALGESPSRGRKSKPNPIHHSPKGFGNLNPAGSKVLFKNIATGETIYGYRGTEPISPKNESPLGDVLAGILLNDLTHLPDNIRASLTTGSDTGGGYLASPALSQRVIDLARANSVVMKAGAITVPVSTGELQLARLTGDPTTAWRGETGALTASKPTFGKFTIRPKMLASMVPVSIELLEDTPNAGAVIESALMAAMGVEIDRVVLEGSGASNEPLGVVNNSGVNIQSSVGAPTTYGQITTAITNILTANYPGEVSSLAWLMNPVIGGTYDGLVTGISSDNTPLEPTPWVRQLRRLYTTNLAGSGSPMAYNMVIGDFSECLVGMRYSGVVIDVIDSGQATDVDGNTWNADTQFLRFIRARIRVDTLLMRPTWFSVLSGVNA